MAHKLDQKRHKRNVLKKLRTTKHRYLSMTRNDSLAPDKVLAVLKDTNELDTAKRLARRLAARGFPVRLAE